MVSEIGSIFSSEKKILLNRNRTGKEEKRGADDWLGLAHLVNAKGFLMSHVSNLDFVEFASGSAAVERFPLQL